jgi:hypothetical protein
MDEPLSHYTAEVSKKIKAKDLERGSILELINTNDISLEENYNFNKHVLPQNFKLINHLLFDFLINKSKGKKIVILLKDKHEKTNRDAMKTIERLAEGNQDVEFFYMTNSEENKKLLKDKFNVEFKNFPQLLVLNAGDNSVKVVPQIEYLKIDKNSRKGLDNIISRSLI